MYIHIHVQVVYIYIYIYIKLCRYPQSVLKGDGDLLPKIPKLRESFLFYLQELRRGFGRG